MISVVTTTYCTPPQVLARTWASLRRQTFTDWEWVVLDDSPDGDNETWRQLYGFAADDRYRITLLRGVHDGRIGTVKRRAFGAATGDVLVELDHDDQLEPDALEHVAQAFADPDVGFCWSDWCEINPAGESCRYPDGWAWGYGCDRWERGVWALSVPVLNRTTLSHIVSAPNHLRAWRASTYHAIGGHDPALDVADDYDLCVRTALATECVHLPHMLYRQHVGQTTQRQRNQRIQQLVAEIHERHTPALDERFGPMI